MNSVDQALRKVKAERGLTVAAVGKAVGVSRVTVNTWRKQGYVPEKWVLAFSKAVSVPPWEVSYLAKEMKTS
jgi:DNA-binding XRE family transcriptional regulator